MKLASLGLAIVLLYVSFLFQASLSQKANNGSFMYTRGPVPLLFRIGDRYPDRNESVQCGPIRMRIKRNSKLYISSLVTNTNPDIIFQTADARVMTSRLQARLNALARRFLGEFSRKIKVLKAWSESSINDSSSDSLHYEGRTVQVHIKEFYVSLLLRLAIDIGFDWVYFDSINYIRLSVIPDSCSVNIDLVFMLDISGSIGHRNHKITLQFIHDVVSFYNISANQTQVGMLTYSTSSHIEFPLDKHQDLSSLQDTLMEIAYHGGQTATVWGHTLATTILKPDEEYGARKYSEGIPKIAILLSHDVSNLYLIAEYATDLRNSGVQVFIVGIGDVFLPELLTISRYPDIQHIFFLRSFSDAPHFVNFLSFTACDTPAIVNPGEKTTTDVDEDHFRYFQSFCPVFSQTVMIEEVDIIGTCNIYASSSVQNPGPLDPSNLVVHNEDRTRQKRSVTLQRSKNRHVYVAVQGLTLHNTFTLIIWDKIFEKNEYDIRVPGGIAVSSLFNLIEVLLTTDVKFNFTITEGDKSDCFSVGLESGIIDLIYPLNTSQSENLLLKIVAQNSQISCNTGTVQLRITVSNDIQSPSLDPNNEFESPSLNPKINDEIESPSLNPTNTYDEIRSRDMNPVRIGENASSGSVVTKIQVLGRSLGINYSLGAGNTGNVFAIDSTTGIITVYGTLNFEVQRSYNLTVTATSYGLPGTLRTVSTIQVVQILDINETPTFTSACLSSTGVCSFTVMESDSDTATVGPLTGEDADLSTLPNGQVTFSLDAILPPTGFHLIQIDETVTIVKNETFDREQSSSFSLTVRITDRGSPPLSSTLVVRILVDDVNDNAPMFIQATPLFSISESTAVGTNIAQYQATDRDSGVNAEISYNLTSVVSLDTPFEINPINGYLRVSLPLDFEAVQSYFLRIIASNPDGLRVETSTTITIVDMNDNAPVFNQGVYNASVSEGDPVGTFLLLVEATDGDFGKDAFNFFIRDGNFNNSFIVNVNGAISLSSEVDREAIPMFNLTVSVTDFGIPRLSSFATVLIHVSDINDNPPIFTQGEHEVFIMEGVESVNIITVTAFDRDEPLSPNSMIIFNLDQNSNIGGVFNLNQINNSNCILHLIGPLKFEALHELHILATDRGSPPLNHAAIIIIRVTHAESFPIFVSGNETILVSEAAPSGFRIAQIYIPLDSMELNFTILSVSNCSTIKNSVMLFDIDSNGVISVREEFNFETSQTFTIRIQVANKDWESTVLLSINTVDENKFSPEFQDARNFSVLEEEPTGTFVGTVEVVDGYTGPASGVTYAILQDSVVATLFNIDHQRGNIFTAHVLDSEQLVEQNLFHPSRGSSDVITVVATYTQVPFHSSTAAVTITLVDINDNPPVIQSFLEPLSIPENEMEGELLVGIVATDTDIGSNGKIKFILTVLEPIIPLGEAVPFVINTTGAITTNAVLDREARSTYVLSLRAADEGQPPQNSPEIRFEVGVTDVNDNAPIFSNDAYEVSVPENVALNTTILIVSATDADNSTTSPQISFVIISSNPPNSTGVFSISSTGQVTVEMPLDFESVQTYFLVIEAVDSGTPAMFTRANLTIRVENVDEAHPVFVKICSVAIVENNVQPGIAIEQCFAVDIDENTGRPNFATPLVYSIISGNLNNTFSIRGSGSIILERNVDREEIDFYSLLIQVTNPDGFSATTFVNVTVIDENDNIPIITNQDLFLNVDSSDIQSGQMIFFRVTAVDADTGDNAKLIYVLNNFTVSVNGMQVTISVTVSDSGAPPLSSSVIITLNFETPCFLQDHMINATNGVLTSRLLCNAILDPANVDVIFGGALELMCSVPLSNIQPTSFEFLHNNSVVSAMESNLIIHYVTFETGGEYTCKVMSDIGSLQSDNGLVRIVLPPEIVLASMDMLIQEGMETKIKCLATGIPEPTITWRRLLNGSGIQEDIVDNPENRFFIEGSILRINSTSVEDQGIYSCIASNSVGEITSSFLLSVFQLSSIVQVQVVMFSNISMTSGKACHDANWLQFETALYEITGALARVTSQNGDNLCNNTLCSSNPCRNNGLCTLQNTRSMGFECTCSAGYTGDNCRIDINECIDDPCSQFGGSCVNTPSGSFTCSCSQGNTGHHCQFQDVCSSTTCPSNQICVLTLTNIAGFICLNLAQEGKGLLRVTIRGETSAQVLGTLNDQVNTFLEGNKNSNSNSSNSNINLISNSNTSSNSNNNISSNSNSSNSNSNDISNNSSSSSSNSNSFSNSSNSNSNNNSISSNSGSGSGSSNSNSSSNSSSNSNSNNSISINGNSNSSINSSSNSNMDMAENETIINNGSMTSCEPVFIPDPNFIQESGNVLVLVWACPVGILPPDLNKLDAICTFLYAIKSVTSCTSPSGMKVPPSSTDLLHTSFTFSFVLLDSNKFPLSGEEALTLLHGGGAIGKLRARGYQVSEFLLAYEPPKPTHNELIVGATVEISVGVTVGVLLIMAGITLMVVLTFLYNKSKRLKKKIEPELDQWDEKHHEKGTSQELPSVVLPPLSPSVVLPPLSPSVVLPPLPPSMVLPPLSPSAFLPLLPLQNLSKPESSDDDICVSTTKSSTLNTSTETKYTIVVL